MARGSSDSSSWTRWLGFGSFAVAGAILVVWLAAGAHFVTQYEVPVTRTETDEFGDEIERTVMKEQFQFGLLPDRGYDGAAPLIVVFVALGGGSLAYGWWQRRSRDS